MGFQWSSEGFRLALTESGLQFRVIILRLGKEGSMSGQGRGRYIFRCEQESGIRLCRVLGCYHGKKLGNLGFPGLPRSEKWQEEDFLSRHRFATSLSPAKGQRFWGPAVAGVMQGLVLRFCLAGTGL
jgi:hypothetical protein